MKVNKPPQRMCVVCRGTFDKKALVRLTADEKEIHVDETGKRPGRGAYVCRDCASKLNRGSFKKAFNVVLEAEALKRLTEELNCGIK